MHILAFEKEIPPIWHAFCLAYIVLLSILGTHGHYGSQNITNHKIQSRTKNLARVGNANSHLALGRKLMNSEQLDT